MLRLKIISDVTDRNRLTIFFGKRLKPRICPTEFFDFNSRYLENKNEFFKNSFETVFRASESRNRGQLVLAFQLTFNRCRFEGSGQKSYIHTNIVGGCWQRWNVHKKAKSSVGMYVSIICGSGTLRKCPRSVKKYFFVKLLSQTMC